MTNVKMTVAYDGTPFHGWQVQPNVKTIQETIKNAIEIITHGTRVNLIGAGRTDAGVHALGQVANFKTDRLFDEKKWKDALNALLPDEIVIRSVEFVPIGFHARFSAIKKSYIYRIGLQQSPFLFKKQWTISYPLKIASMKRAMRYLIGKHDFSSFAATSSESESKICHLMKAEFFKEKEALEIRLTADRFLTHMVRAIVGTLVEIGSGKIRPKEMEAILQSRDRTKAGKTAPAHGLYLENVRYPKTLL